MKRWLLLGFAVLVLSVAVLLQYYSSDGMAQSRQLSALERVGDDCHGIAHKSAMHLPEELPFQKLEKSARTVRVFESCMHDRGFDENPDWVAFAQPIAQQFSVAQNVSFDEAFELIRREHMQTLKQPTTQPSYWVRSKQG